ncbi:MAG: hypothetical protein ACYTF9_03830 [Planctomycetota bacterium]|jgi:hypothetical protein
MKTLTLAITRGAAIWTSLRATPKTNKPASSISSPRSGSASPQESVLDENLPWLKERWRLAHREFETGHYRIVERWFFDAATAGQLARIDAIGLGLSCDAITKGQASDIIGLFESVAKEEKQILRFFKVPLAGVNQTRARHEAAVRLADARQRAMWESRPATPWQKEFYHVFEYPVPRGLTFQQADRFIKRIRSSLLDDQTEKFREWQAYQALFEQLVRPDTRDDEELDETTVPAFRSAIVSLLEEDRAMEELRNAPELVMERLIRDNPRLRRA